MIAGSIVTLYLNCSGSKRVSDLRDLSYGVQGWRGGSGVRIFHSGGPQRAVTALAMLPDVLLFLLGLSVLA